MRSDRGSASEPLTHPEQIPGYTLITAAELPAAPGPHPAASRYDKGIGQALGIHAFGIYQVELPPGAKTVRHDHSEDRAEDVYRVLSGSGVVVVDEEEVRVAPGQYIAVEPDSIRHVRAGDSGLIFIAVCAAAAELIPPAGSP